MLPLTQFWLKNIASISNSHHNSLKLDLLPVSPFFLMTVCLSSVNYCILKGIYSLYLCTKMSDKNQYNSEITLHKNINVAIWMDKGNVNSIVIGHGHLCGIRTRWRQKRWCTGWRCGILTRNGQLVTHIYSPCPDSTPSLQPMSRRYPSSTAHTEAVSHLYSPYPDSTQYLKPMSSQYSVSAANVQTVPHLYSPIPVSTPSLTPMSNQYPNVFSPGPAFTHL